MPAMRWRRAFVRMMSLAVLLFATVWDLSAQYYGRQVGSDGFVWKRVQSGNFEGAESESGETLVPAQYGMVVYQSQLDGWFTVYDRADHQGCYDRNGKQILPIDRQYTFVSKVETGGVMYYIVQKGDFTGVCDTAGNEIIAPERQYTSVTLFESEGSFYYGVKKGDRSGACNISGKEIIAPVYNKGLIYSENTFKYQRDDGTWATLNVSLSPGGASGRARTGATTATAVASTVSVKALFDEAFNTPDSQADTKIKRYLRVIEADVNNREGYQVVAYNNLGVLGEAIGDYNGAKQCYERALQISPSYSKADENLKALKRKQRNERLNRAANVLGAFGSAFESAGAASGGVNTYGSGTYSGGASGHSSGSSGSSVCRRCNGSGKCSSSSGTADKYYCHGSGRCGYCNGNGVIHKYGQTIKCNSCNGTGRCRYCNGTGKCHDCGGSGKR